MRDYYLLIDGQQVGPYTADQLHERLAQDELTSESPAWYDGLPDWAQLGTILEAEAPPIQADPAPEPEAPTQVSAPVEATAPVVISISKTGLRRGAYAMGFLLILFLIYYFASPFYALHALKNAIVAGDGDALDNHIDYPAVRESLKQEMKAQMASSMSKDTSMFAGLAEAMAPSIINNEIDANVTPEGTIKYFASFANGTDPSDKATNMPIEHMGFDSPNDFRFTCLDIKFHMHFYGTSWKVYRLQYGDVVAKADSVKSVFTTISSQLATNDSTDASTNSPSTSTSSADADPGYMFSKEFQSATVQQTRSIALAMFSYANDHDQKYPDGKTSTEVFQKLIDGKYVDDPSVFCIPHSGKTKAVKGQPLKAENVSFDVTSPVDNTTPDGLPVVFSTGFIVAYTSGASATQSLGGEDMPPGGISVCTKGNETDFRLADDHGNIRTFIPLDFDPGIIAYQQLTPDGKPFETVPSPFPALDAKNGFRSYLIGMALSSISPDELDAGYDTADTHVYHVQNFDKKMGNAEIKGIDLTFSQGLLKEISVEVEGEQNKLGLKDALITAYGQPEKKNDFGGEYLVWAGQHTQLRLSGLMASDDTMAVFTNIDVDLKIEAITAQKAKQGAAAGAKNL